jgi:hypothetical protein
VARRGSCSVGCQVTPVGPGRGSVSTVTVTSMYTSESLSEQSGTVTEGPGT